MANSSSLSNVVSSLVRAQMGSSVPSNTLDEELDRRVAELILKEAKKREDRFGRTGSYSPQPANNAVKTNKRFLSSVIKSTDEHNKAVLRAQAESANEIKQQREREEREERMRRAREAATARRGLSPAGRHSRTRDDYGRHDDSREDSEQAHSSRHGRKRRRDRHSDSESDDDRRHKRSKRDDERERDRSVSLERQQDRKKERDHGDDRRSSHKTSRRDKDHEERRSHHKSRRRSRSRSPTREKHRKREDADSKASSSTRHRSSRDDRDQARSGSLDKSRSKDAKKVGGEGPRSTEDIRTRSTKDATADENGGAAESDNEFGPLPTTNGGSSIPSKMDKYFSEDYDPRLDVTTSLTAMDGFIPPGAFDNWDYMLQVVRQRREEKEERKRLEKVHRGSSSGKSKNDKSASTSQAGAEMADLLSMQYTKKGGVREWDEGKKEI